jgi:two-component sensor histidine kinase
VLLREIHHRVKNNLQTVSSLLSLQSGYIEDQQALEILKSSQQRIRTMALIHEKLYQSRDLSRIEFREYVESLVAYLFELYSLQSGQVQLKMQMEEVVLDIDTCIPAGLIINELVSNSLKYAFPDFRQGELRIILEKSPAGEHDYTLIVGDDGIGLPQDLDFQEPGTLGMVLVNSLVKQLNGIIDLDSNGGTTVTIKFQKLNYGDNIE